MLTRGATPGTPEWPTARFLRHRAGDRPGKPLASVTAPPVPAASGVPVSRWSRAATVTTAAAAVALAVLAAAPYLVGAGVTQPLVTLFLLVSMAVLWNLLAGYAGMLSFGQQAYLGIGAYAVYLVSKGGVSPFAAIVAAALACAVAAVPIFALLRRLTGGYFAVATWVVAECLFLYVINQQWIGGATGVGLQQLSSMSPVVRQAYTYWAALVVMTVCVAGVYLLVRSRFGLDSRAVHDEPAAAATMGVEVGRTRWIAYLLAAAGAGAVGGILIVSTLYTDPGTVFSVNYSADMLFMVVIGGLGTMEGPVIGAVVFFAVQQEFSSYGAWYLVAIGAVAVIVVLAAPGGLWGLAARRGWSLLPVGYRVGAVPPGGSTPTPRWPPAPFLRHEARVPNHRGGVTAVTEGSCTTSRVLLETMREAGIRYLFANLGSDHTGILEAYAQAGQHGPPRNFPDLVLCPHEGVALSAAQGYAQVSGEAQAVLVHTDCGTQNLGGAVHNAARGRVPVLILAGLSPMTAEGELPGSRNEFIQWIQDTPDQQGLVRGYVKYSHEIRTGVNAAQLVRRALQIARSEPAGPVYLAAAREVLEQPAPAQPAPGHWWSPVAPAALAPQVASVIAAALRSAAAPLVVTSYLGRDPAAVAALVELCELAAVPVLESVPMRVNFPASHPLHCGYQWNALVQNRMLAEADVILVAGSDVPWMPAVNRPGPVPGSSCSTWTRSKSTCRCGTSPPPVTRGPTWPSRWGRSPPGWASLAASVGTPPRPGCGGPRPCTTRSARSGRPGSTPATATRSPRSTWSPASGKRSARMRWCSPRRSPTTRWSASTCAPTCRGR